MTDYRIVPVEPTTGMCCAALDANRELSDESRPLRVGYELVDAPVIYAAMLSAAPAVDLREKVVDSLSEWFERQGAFEDTGNGTIRIRDRNDTIAEFSHFELTDLVLFLLGRGGK